MGATARVTVTTTFNVEQSQSLIRAAQDEIERLESLWSRFRPDSEISGLNHGRPAETLSQPTRSLLELAELARHKTNGLFDHRLGDEIVLAGYTTSVSTSRPGTTSSTSHDAVTFSNDSPTGFATPATRVDVGGIAKGFAADYVAEFLIRHGACGVLVSLGGDIRCLGESDHDRGWEIEVESPDETTALDRITIAEGGIATSSLTARRWNGISPTVSHVIDPRSRLPVDPTRAEIVQATVLASTAAWAEAFATACLVADPICSVALLDRNGLAGLLVRGDGSTITNMNWGTFE